MEFTVKKEIIDTLRSPKQDPGNDTVSKRPPVLIELDSSSSSSSSSDSDSDSESDNGNNPNAAVSTGPRVSSTGHGVSRKKRKLDELGVVLPVGFLAPLSPAPLALPQSAVDVHLSSTPTAPSGNGNVSSTGQSSKQFWKAGDYEGAPCGDWDSSSGILSYFAITCFFFISSLNEVSYFKGQRVSALKNYFKDH